MAPPHEPAPAPADGMCQESTGFLFSHACDRFAAHACTRCGKWVCNEHNHEGLEGAICTTCAKELPPPAPTDDPQAQSQNDPQSQPPGASPQAKPTTGSPRTGYYRDDPYFYGSYWYPGYGYHRSSHYHRSSSSSDSSPSSDQSNVSNSGHDPYDFTEGDAESLRQEGDDAFETDLGES